MLHIALNGFEVEQFNNINWFSLPKFQLPQYSIFDMGLKELGMLFITVLPSCAAMTFPNINIGLQNANTPQDFTNGLQILIWLTILTLAPSILIMTTCFVRLVVVLALTRQAIGTSTLPPNQVIAGLALILTFFVMAPTVNTINETAIQPYMKNQITQQAALERAATPIRDFMIKQTHEKELELFLGIAKAEQPKNWSEVPTYIILPAFILSELKTAFKIGFIIFLICGLSLSGILLSGMIAKEMIANDLGVVGTALISIISFLIMVSYSSFSALFFAKSIKKLGSSKCIAIGALDCLPPFSLVTRALATPMRSMFLLRIFARLGTGSLHTSSPSPLRYAASWVDFPPGAAQRSNTFSPGWRARAAAAAMALGSCR